MGWKERLLSLIEKVSKILEELGGIIVDFIEEIGPLISSIKESVSSIRAGLDELKQHLLQLLPRIGRAADAAEAVSSRLSKAMEKEVEAYREAAAEIERVVSEEFNVISLEEQRIRNSFLETVVGRDGVLERLASASHLDWRGVADAVEAYRQLSNLLDKLSFPKDDIASALLETIDNRFHGISGRITEIQAEYERLVDETTGLLARLDDIVVDLGLIQDSMIYIPVYYVVYEDEEGEHTEIVLPGNYRLGPDGVVYEPFFPEDAGEELLELVKPVVEELVSRGESLDLESIVDRGLGILVENSVVPDEALSLKQHIIGRG